MTLTDRSHTVTTTAADGTQASYDYSTAAASLAAFHEFATAGTTVHRLSAKGNVLNGYRAEQGPVAVVNGRLVSQ